MRDVDQPARGVRADGVNPAGEQIGSTVLCRTGVPTGGGAYSSSTSTAVAINSSYPVTGGWRAYMNNDSKTNATFNPYVICSG